MFVVTLMSLGSDTLTAEDYESLKSKSGPFRKTDQHNLIILLVTVLCYSKKAKHLAHWFLFFLLFSFTVDMNGGKWFKNIQQHVNFQDILSVFEALFPGALDLVFCFCLKAKGKTESTNGNQAAK